MATLSKSIANISVSAPEIEPEWMLRIIHSGEQGNISCQKAFGCLFA